MPSFLESAKPIDEYPEWFKALVYGEGGTWKTSFAATAPNPIWVDFERSTDTLRHIGKGHIPAIRPKSMLEVDNIIKEFIKSPKFETIVFDTATRMQLFQLSEHMVDVKRAQPGRDRFLPYQADYRRSGNVLDDMFARLQDAEKHVIVNAHRKVFVDPDTKKITAILPDLTPRLKDAIAGLLNVVAYVELKPGSAGKPPEQIMNFVSSGRYFAKNRLNLITSQTNPTFDTVFKKGTNYNAS